MTKLEEDTFLMKASELRIGNYVQEENNAILELSSIGELCNIKRLSAAYHIDELSPIPLTEEWLLKFGFDGKGHYLRVETPDFELNQHLTLQVLIGVFDKKASVYAYCDDEMTKFNGQIVIIQYVHQLQNLYFALTGEELEVK